MIKIRKSNERGQASHGWLNSQHTFSFADYFDPASMGFSVLRVINEDSIDGGSGFGTHGHQDMEIISYVKDGALEHRDSMENSTIISPGEIQRMSAGTGVGHSEFNHFKDRKTNFLQIWIMPEKKGIKPSYEQKSVTGLLEKKPFVQVASPKGSSEMISVNQDVNIFVGKSNAEGNFLFEADAKRKIWIQLISGGLNINGQHLDKGDGAAITETVKLDLQWEKNSEFLLFDMPA